MKKLLLSILFLFALSSIGFAQIFTQNFTSSTNISDYVNALAPANGQFNTIGASNSNALFSINNNALRLTRISTLSATAQFTRNLITPGAQAFLGIKFNLSVTSSTTAATTAATFYVGDNFLTTNTGTPTTANGHSRFALNLTTNPTEFSLREITGTTNSAVFSGPQQIFFAVNNSNFSINYLAPDGTFKSVPNDSWDLWVGNARVFTAVAAWGTSDLNAIKFMFTGGMANIDITNIEIDNLTTLPVTFTSFTGKANGQNIDLNWKTASEQKNSHFDVMRSIAGKPSVKIGTVNGNGNTQTPQNYNYTDTQPLPGTNYYQLKQVDNDGTETLYKDILAIKSNVTASNFKIVSRRDKNAVDLSVFAAVDGNSTFKIYDLSGRKLIDKSLTLTKGYNNFSLPLQLTSQGVHVATLTTISETITNKFIQ